MKNFRLQVVTPDGSAFDGEAQALLLRTSEGYVGIRADHADYMAALDIGEVVITNDGKERHAACGGGFVTVISGEVRMVTSTFEYSEDIDRTRAENARTRAEEKIRAAKDERELEMAKAKLLRALNRIRVSGGE